MGAVIVLAVIPTYGAQKWRRTRRDDDVERRLARVRPSNPRAHVEKREESHPHTWPGMDKSVGRSYTYASRARGRGRGRRASENFYDTLAAFMSRVNLANSASFAPKHLAAVFRRFSAHLPPECTAGDAIKPARNDAVPQSLLLP